MKEGSVIARKASPSIVPLYRITLGEFLALPPHTPENDALITRGCSDPDFTDGHLLRFNPITDLRYQAHRNGSRLKAVDCDIEGYTIKVHKPAELLAVFDETGLVVGGVTCKRLLVVPEHRGRHLGSEILIRAFETGVMNPRTMNFRNNLTLAGRANRASAHRIAVERAVKAGIDVSYEVLSDYLEHFEEWTMTAPIVFSEFKFGR